MDKKSQIGDICLLLGKFVDAMQKWFDLDERVLFHNMAGGRGFVCWGGIAWVNSGKAILETILRMTMTRRSFSLCISILNADVI